LNLLDVLQGNPFFLKKNKKFGTSFENFAQYSLSLLCCIIPYETCSLHNWIQNMTLSSTTFLALENIMFLSNRGEDVCHICRFFTGKIKAKVKILAK